MTGKVGFIGLGAMGGPMARNLIKADVPLVVHDIDASKTAKLNAEVASSAAPARSAAVTASQASLVSELNHTLAGEHPLAFVPDADDDGTVLITALAAAGHRAAFGPHSRAAHLAAGYVELDVPLDWGLRRDVDTAAQLAALSTRVGPRTRALL